MIAKIMADKWAKPVHFPALGMGENGCIYLFGHAEADGLPLYAPTGKLFTGIKWDQATPFHGSITLENTYK